MGQKVRKYVEALADVAFEMNSAEETLADLRKLESVIALPELSQTLEHAGIPFEAKRALAETIAARMGISSIVTNFLLVLIEKVRIPAYGELVDDFERVVDERKGLVHVTVTSAKVLSSETKRKLQEQVEKAYGGLGKMDYEIDPKLIGGLKLQVGSTVLDGTVKVHLEQLKKLLTG